MKKFFIITNLLLIIFTVFSQPYFPTYIKNDYYKQNIFINAKVNTQIPPKYQTIKEQLPQIIWPARPDIVEAYNKAWEIAFSHLKAVEKASGLISPFIDPAFNNHLFMWDCTFMTLYGKYASRVFNIQQTLDNFYARQHPDGFICREIREKDASDMFERFDPSSTGPDIMPWSEWEYFLNFNDTVRLRKVFSPLLAYYQWYAENRTWQDGTYFSTGWGCGMDNQPRLPKGVNRAWSHGHLSWIDISLQEVFAGKILLKMANELHDTKEAKQLKKQIDQLSNTINSTMWDKQQAFYFDKERNGKITGVKSIAAYWALLAKTTPAKQLDAFIAHLENLNEFNRKHRVPTLSADNPDFDPNGGYWRGSVWAPTNYMVIRGLTVNGYDSLAFQIAKNHVDNVVAAFKKQGTFFENYAPDKIQGNDRKNFVGWTGLAPISVLLEYVLGIRADVPNNQLILDINMKDEYQVKNYPFGTKGMLNIKLNKRKSITQKPRISLISNTSFTLILKWNGKQRKYKIKKGKNNI